MSVGATVSFHGVRGSTPCAGDRYERYGGNTSCVSLEADDHDPVILDLGTGLRPYGEQLETEGRADGFRGSVLLTHLHWDHVQGLPFFGPLSYPGSSIDVYGPAQPDASFGTVFGELMKQPFFPIRSEQLSGAVRFHGAGNDDFPVDGAKVRSRWVRHTSPTLGFRVDLNGVSVAYLSDHGPGCSADPDDFVPRDVLDLCDGVDLLIHDAQHTCGEYETHRHFGHSTVDYAVHVARESGAQRLALFHHCPSHSDSDVDRLLLHAGDLAARRGVAEVIAAAEGLQLTLGVAHP